MPVTLITHEGRVLPVRHARGSAVPRHRKPRLPWRRTDTGFEVAPCAFLPFDWRISVTRHGREGVIQRRQRGEIYELRFPWGPFWRTDAEAIFDAWCAE